jgi:hypothetical protein
VMGEDDTQLQADPRPTQPRRRGRSN